MPRVLLLHTGGTLGMRGAPLTPDSYSAGLREEVPELTEIAEIDSAIVCNLDSSDVGPEHWTRLAQHIERGRDDYDGFVIVHGTDTMAYTASALAFSLEGLDRPVIMTGAQRPLAALRSDARRNLADAVELATCDIPEVSICFDGLLLRGCRATKSNTRTYRAFDSPGTEHLARLGVSIDIYPHIRRPAQPFRCDPRFHSGVLVITITPGLDPILLQRMLTSAGPDLRGIVLAAFGPGTLPTNARAIAPVMAEVIEGGVDVLVITQSAGHVDLSLYQNSLDLLTAGAIPGGALLLEAATTKLMHALAIHPDDPDARRRYLEWNVAGELG